MDPNQQQTVQTQLRVYLRNHRKNQALSAVQGANELGMKISSYRKLEGEKPENRVISSIGYLQRIAALKELSVNEFLSYLTCSHIIPQKRYEGNKARDLHKWEADILRLFNKISIPKRNEFIANMNSMDEKHRSFVFETLCLMAQKNQKNINLIRDVAKGLQDDP
ncbi:MAG: hypothetical protein H6618_09415 [Deltaproteobacteria bacterium]|nr:hypothetical protein [Deltaproteobacteria bacterium]